MSCYHDDYFAASSNNSINENKYNAKKDRQSSKVHQLKRLLKPIVHLLLKSNKRNSYVKNAQPDCFLDSMDTERSQNDANELLEKRIFEEIDSCPDFAAVPVYDGDQMDIVPVTRGQAYVPVHFARTSAGTFFWTTVSGPDSDICCDGDKNAFSSCQVPELQTPCDRWAQA